ncbi:MAG TPA: MFS transporter [Syntrophales bacterium]|nr:MFS transporter [Syntrophales bacterium]HOL59353.1 MFS transporter [Syntrophales bacterium]HPO35455.1 MFS transporter [Syntrophales bacterium]
MTEEKMDKTGMRVAIAIFVALTVDGMDLQMLALSLPSIMKEYNVSTIMGGALGTYTLLGMGIGGILAGWLSDRFGRVRVVKWAVLTFSLFTALIGVSSSFTQVACLRFLSGFGIAALYSVGTLLAAEYVPTRIRTTVLGTLQAGWSVGYVLAAILSSWILPAMGWRPLFLMAIVPGIICLLLMIGMKDPESWFAARTVAKAAEKPQNEFALLWQNKSIRWIFLLWCFTSIMLQFGYYGANTWLPSYLVKDLHVNLKSMGWYVAATYTLMVVGKIVTGYLGDIFGRRVMWVLAGICTALYLPAVIYFATPGNIAYLLLFFGFLYGAPYAINSTYMSESFPASVRGTAVATAYNVGRIGSTISPLVIGIVAKSYSVGAGLAILGISYALCGLIPGLFIREKMFDPKSTKEEDIKA